MNSTINLLNFWAEPARDFAGSMLWQSSLVIGLLFALDYLLRPKLRAAVRYALWLIVLVKLALPPSLTLPTGVGWWMPKSILALPAYPHAAALISQAPVGEDLFLARNAPDQSAPGHALLSPMACGLGVSAFTSFGLFGWMLVCWRRVARARRKAAPAPQWLRELLEASRQNVGLDRSVELRLVERAISPAVCGLWRPVILIPRALIDTLSACQLRSILLHELIHLRRGDLWVNGLQTLLQIVYWWHPFLWLANRQIRRVREEAVDDTVMLALQNEADIYAPTLLQVAKLSLHSSVASLGMVGILESHTWLRHRIERLIDFIPPPKAGLSWASVLGLVIFGALILPMGKAPVSLAAPSQAPKLQAGSEVVAATTPQDRNVGKNLSPINPGRKAIHAKLNSIHLKQVQFDNLPLTNVIKLLDKEVRELDPAKQGLNFILNPNREAPVDSPPSSGVDLLSVRIHLRSPLKNVRLAQVLDAIINVADAPIEYSVEEYAVVFRNASGPKLYVRTIQADPSTFVLVLGEATGEVIRHVPQAFSGAAGFEITRGGITQTITVSDLIRRYLRSKGFDLDPSTTLFYNDRTGIIYFRASQEEIEKILPAIQELTEKSNKLRLKPPR